MFAEIVSVASTPTPIISGRAGHVTYTAAGIVLNQSGATVYLGGPTVDTTNGYPFPSGSLPVSLDLVGPGEILYGIVVTGTANLNVLRRGGSTV